MIRTVIRAVKCSLFAVLTLAVCLSSSSCGITEAKRELNSIAIVMGIGIDNSDGEEREYESGPLKVTAQVMRTGSGSSGSGGGGGSGGESGGGGGSESGGGSPSDSSDSTSRNLTMLGEDMFPMLRGATHQSNRQLYLSHNQLILFGEDFARQGIRDQLDYFFRDHETRYNVLIAVGDNCKAEEILNAQSNTDSLPSQEISKLLQRQRQNAQSATMTLFDFIVDTLSQRKASLAPLVGIQKSPDGKNENFYVTGCAVFNECRMVGKLNASETRGLLWCTGNLASAVFAVDMKDTRVSTEVIRSDGRISVDSSGVDKGERLKVKIKVNTDTVVGHVDKGIDFSDSDAIKEIERNCDQFIEAEIRALIDKSRELGSDVFGLSDYIWRHRPDKWRIIEDDWEQIFNEAQFDIEVKCDVMRTGSLINPVFDSEAHYDE